MGFRINTNINAIDTQRNLMMTSTNMATTMRRLSSGLRINSAADDAAGLAIAQKLGAQVNGLNQAVRNAQDGISLVQTAEGAMNETQSILQRMRTLAVQSANDTNTQTDRTSIQSEMNQLAIELSRISNTTSFNTKNLLAGGFSGQNLQIGANSGETMNFSIGAMDAATLGVAANGANVSSAQNTANVTNVANVGKGFTNGANYTINSTSVNAGQLLNGQGVAKTGTVQGQNLGNETMNVQGAFAGSSNANYIMRVSGTSPDGTKVSQIQYSSDNGATWATSNGQLQKDGTYSFQVSTLSSAPGTDSGLSFNFTPPTSGAVNPVLGDQFSFAATAAQKASALTAAATYTFGGGVTAGTISASAGNYMGNLSGDMKIKLTSVNSGTSVGTATVTIGSTTFNATVASPQASSSTVGAIANAGNTGLTVNFMGMSYVISGLTGGTGAASDTFTADLGNVSAVSVATNNTLSSGIGGSTVIAGNYNAGATYTTKVLATGVSTASNITTTETGQYTGASGTLQLVAVGGTFNSTTGYLINSSQPTTSTTSVALGATVFTAATATADARLAFSYGGANFTMTGGALNTVATGDVISIALANNGGASTGGDITVSTSANTGGASATSAASNVGSETMNVAGAYLGAQSTPYTFKVASVSNNQVTGLQFSTDGGNSWSNATGTLQTNGSYTFQAQQKSSNSAITGTGGDSGLVFNFTTPTNAVAPQAGDTFSYNTVGQNVLTTTTVAGATTPVAVNGMTLTQNGTTAATSSATISGTYTGPYSGALQIVSTASAAAAIGTAVTSGVSVKIGNTTLDPTQVQVTGANTGTESISFMGITYALTISGSAANQTFTFNGPVLTAATNAQNATLSGNQLVTTSNNNAIAAGTTTAPSVSATATETGAGVAGLGSGQIELLLKDYNAGSVGGTSSIGINNIAWMGTGTTAKVGGNFQAVATTADSTDFSYNSVTGHDSNSLSAYSGSINVTGVDGNTYKLSVTNANSTGATVAIQNAGGTTTYALYNVATTGQKANDIVSLNVGGPNTGVTAGQNVGAELGAVSGTYTGSANQAYTVQVAGVDANGNVSQIKVSQDGGKTYGAAIVANSPYTTSAPTQTLTTFNLGNGLTFTMTPGQANQNKAALSDTFNFMATASTSNGGTGGQVLQLQSGSTNVGNAQLVSSGQTSATLGTSSMSMVAGFGAIGTSGGLAAGSTTVTTQVSQSAVIGVGGTVTTNASTYAGLDVTSQATAQAAIATIDAAINTVSLARAQMGAIQNRLQHTINNLSVSSENLNAAQSRIQDVDVAAETVNMTKNQILEQAGISVLAQANQQPQMVLKLLQ